MMIEYLLCDHNTKLTCASNEECRAGPNDCEDETLWSKVGNDSVYSVAKLAALSLFRYWWA